MDCLEKVVHLLDNNYYVRRSVNTRTGTDTRFDNFVSSLNLALGVGDEGLEPNVMKHLFCHGLNSILLREGKQTINGRYWDLDASYLMAYASMGSVFDELWQRQILHSCINMRYEFVRDLNISAGIPYVTAIHSFEKIANGVRILGAYQAGGRVLEFNRMCGRFRLYPLGYYFASCRQEDPGSLPWAHGGFARIEGANMANHYEYTLGAMTTPLTIGDWHIFDGGYISVPVAGNIAVDIEFDIISANNENAVLSRITTENIRPNLIPLGEELPIDFVRFIRTFMSRFFVLPNAGNHLLTLEYYEKLALGLSSFNFNIFVRLIMFLKEIGNDGN